MIETKEKGPRAMRPYMVRAVLQDESARNCKKLASIYSALR